MTTPYNNFTYHTKFTFTAYLLSTRAVRLSTSPWQNTSFAISAALLLLRRAIAKPLLHSAEVSQPTPSTTPCIFPGHIPMPLHHHYPLRNHSRHCHCRSHIPHQPFRHHIPRHILFHNNNPIRLHLP